MSNSVSTRSTGGEAQTICSSVAPVLRIGRRLKIAAEVLAALERPPAEPTLACVQHSAAPQLRAITERISIGRGAAAAWPIDDAALSRLHFEIERSPSGCILRDLGSHNGTRVNDAPCTERNLADGDLIQAGRQTFVFLAGIGELP